MARPNSSARARRLIALLSRLEPDSRTRLETLAGQLGATPEQIATDLTTLSFCGVAPYDPFGLVPVMVDGDEVVVFGEVPALKGPVRLSPAETEALAAALQAAGFEAEEPLVTRLIASASAAYPAGEIERTVRASISGHDVGVYERLAGAASDHEVVEIEYASAGSDDATCRPVEPFALFAERGAWYLLAWCRSAGGWRTFRLDRVRQATPTGERFDPAARPGPPQQLTALDVSEMPLARLVFAPGEPFSEREWPGAAVAGEQSDGSLLVDVPFAGTGWLARHVAARLGAVSVLEPMEVREAVRVLAQSELDRLG